MISKAKLKGKVVKAKNTFSVKFNAFMVAALPAVLYIQEQMPALKQLMTVEAYQSVGLFVVLANIAIKLWDQDE